MIRRADLSEVAREHVSQHVQSALLDVVDEADEAGAAAGVRHHQQHLGPPELDVVLPHVQHQQVLTHLGGAFQLEMFSFRRTPTS